MNLLMSWGLEGLAIILSFWWATVALIAHETRARALGYCTGLAVGGTYAVGGPVQGLLALACVLLVVWVLLPAAAKDGYR